MEQFRLFTPSESALAAVSPERNASLRRILPDSTGAYGADGGQLSFRWTTNADRIYVPSRSYFLMDVSVTDGGAALDNTFIFNPNPGLRMLNNVSYSINGVQVETSQQPASDGERLQLHGFDRSEYLVMREPMCLDSSGQVCDGARTAFEFAFKAPISVMWQQNGFPGGAHEVDMDLASTVATRLSRLLSANPASAADTVTINSVAFYVYEAQPQGDLRIPRQISVPYAAVRTLVTTTNSASSTQVDSQLSIPIGTFALAVHLCAAADQTRSPLAITDASGSPYMQSFSVNYGGRVYPLNSYNTINSTTAGDAMRSYFDTLSALDRVRGKRSLALPYTDWRSRAYWWIALPHAVGENLSSLTLSCTSKSEDNGSGYQVVATCFYSASIDMTYSNGILESVAKRNVV